MIKDYAHFGQVAVMRVFDHERWLWPDVTDPQYLNYLYTLPTTKSFWKKVGDYGDFDYPDDHHWWLDMWMYDNLAQKGEAKHIWVDAAPSTPKLCYLLPFDDMTVKGDAHGNHVGTHPKGAWVIDKALLQTFVDATQGIFPLPKTIKSISGFSSLNVRKQAGLGSPIIGTLRIGDSITLLPDLPVKLNSYVWRKIQHGSLVGWIAYSLVTI